jgi:hypothetical protein
MEHERWLAHQAEAGYVFGPVRNDDPELGDLTHPDMVAWDELDEAARQKDRDAVANLLPLLAAAGLRAYRIT